MSAVALGELDGALSPAATVLEELAGKLPRPDLVQQRGHRVADLLAHNARPASDVAEVGSGEAFLTTDYKQIITQLMVLVFGSKYRSKVIEAFRLMGE